MPMVINTATLFPLLGDMTAGKLAPGALAKVGLFTNNYTPLPSTVLADLTEAAYTGYARVILAAWGSPTSISPTEVSNVSTAVMQFPGPTSGAGVIVYGCFWVDATDLLIGAERFSAPVALNTSLDVINLVPKFTYSAPTDVTFFLSAG